MKLVNNVLLAFTAEGVANPLALAHRLGLELITVVEAFDGGPLISAWESGKLHRIAEGNYSAEFALALALKDVHLALSVEGPSGSRSWPLWRRNGRRSSMADSVLKT